MEEHGSSSPQQGGMWELVITLLPLGCALLIYSLSGIRMCFFLLSLGRAVPWCRQP